MRTLYLLFGLSTFVLLSSCGSGGKEEAVGDPITFTIQELSDEEYPDNPDIGFRSKEYSSDFFKSGSIIPKKKNLYDIAFYSTDAYDNDLYFKNIDLDEFIPTVPVYLKDNDYLKYISLINQEWNRNEVIFDTTQFESSDKSITRIDIARNCLSSYLWEVIVFKEEDHQVLPVHHGWFHFPEDLYHELFERKNNVSFDMYKKPLEHWIDPASEKVDLNDLRVLLDTKKPEFEDASDEPYPIAGARKKKFKEIVYPTSFSSMKEFQSDSTLFATFDPPGYYNKEHPRKTMLGRFYNLKDVSFNTVKSKFNDENHSEIILSFSDRQDHRKTKLVIGGIDLKDFPKLDPDFANYGWKNSMGIGNHSFFETYEVHEKIKADHSPYYALLLNNSEQFMDSHYIGIDGPLFHLSEDGSTLHLWLLSFERHALVGHYKIKLPVPGH